MTPGINLSNMSQDFYRNLPVMQDFNEIFDARFYREVPPGWLVVITDVKGSTKAIEQGHYKDVNSAGSLAAIAIANILGHMDFPFVFGGDGMTCLIPPEALGKVQPVLAGLEDRVLAAFGLKLRTGVIPVESLYSLGGTLRCARLRVSPQYTQAVLDGTALDLAEEMLKSRSSDVDETSQKEEPDLRGYSCRWKDFPSPQEETLALILRLRIPDWQYSRWILEEICRKVGAPEVHHPLRLEDSRPRWTSAELRSETAVFGAGKGWAARFLLGLSIRLQILLVTLMGITGLPLRLGGKIIRDSARDNISSSDYRKFDGNLKMILAVTRNTREDLVHFLEEERRKGRIYYGIHVSNRAILTCLMKSETGQEVHFVDAADGGYALAAKKLKAQMKAG